MATLSSESECIVCNKVRHDMTKLDGHAICKNAACLTQPTCIEAYTEQYLCCFCNQPQQVNETICHMFYYPCTNVTEEYKYMCHKCFIEYDLTNPAQDQKHYWRHVTDAELLHQIQTLYDLITSNAPVTANSEEKNDVQ